MLGSLTCCINEERKNLRDEMKANSPGVCRVPPAGFLFSPFLHQKCGFQVQVVLNSWLTTTKVDLFLQLGTLSPFFFWSRNIGMHIFQEIFGASAV